MPLDRNYTAISASAPDAASFSPASEPSIGIELVSMASIGDAC
jgi:hypothetical protein